MERSKFKFWILFPFIVFLLVTGVLFVIISSIIIKWPEVPMFVYGFLGLFVFSWIWLLFGEIRTKAIIVEINVDSIRVKNFGGFGSWKSYYFADFDGFVTAILPSRYDQYEYLYLVRDSKKIIKISEFYHRNYFEIKNSVEQKAEYLGEEKISFFREIKEIFE